MALVKDTLKSDLKTAILSAANTNAQDNVSLDEAIDRIAEAVAGAVDKYVKTAKVTVTAPTGAISVQGSPTAQSNVAPIQIEGELS